MEDGDPSVIVESIVNSDGSVFVDERDFNNYCNNHLTHHSVEDSQSSVPQGNKKRSSRRKSFIYIRENRITKKSVPWFFYTFAY